jgi:hypothetical protein
VKKDGVEVDSNDENIEDIPQADPFLPLFFSGWLQLLWQKKRPIGKKSFTNNFFTCRYVSFLHKKGVKSA